MKMKWNESGFTPPLCTYRLNWARRTSWGWWDDWDDTVLQTQDSKFEPWRSEAEHATSRSWSMKNGVSPRQRRYLSFSPADEAAVYPFFLHVERFAAFSLLFQDENVSTLSVLRAPSLTSSLSQKIRNLVTLDINTSGGDFSKSVA